jgi:hypothetical protein
MASKNVKNTVVAAPVGARTKNAERYLKRHPNASSHEVAKALRLTGSWAPQQAVAALEKLVREGVAKKAKTPEGVRYSHA